MEKKCLNPIIFIDELDKISRTEHGKEIIGILTHLTDPSQNTEFTDKYFSGIKFDISKNAAGTYTVKIMPEGITYQIVKN